LPGALVALLAASIPCTVIVFVITALFREWQGNAIAQAAIHGAVAAATIAIAAVSLIILLTAELDTLWIILASAAVSLSASSVGLIARID
jgi:chromate transport protein ChrA